MQVGDQMVEGKQEQNADPKSRKRREEGHSAHGRRLLDGWNQQAPDGGCHHHSRGKAH